MLFGPLDRLEEDAVVEGAAVGALCGGGGDYVIPMQTAGLGDSLEDLENVRILVDRHSVRTGVRLTFLSGTYNLVGSRSLRLRGNIANCDTLRLTLPARSQPNQAKRCDLGPLR